MRALYSFLFYVALPFVFLRLLWRSRRAPLYRADWAERLGYYDFSLEGCIWIHAVSLGETIAAIPLIRALREKHPESPILVTNMTVTGRGKIRAAFGDTVKSAYIPYDLPDALARFFKKITPRVLVIMETELWPNLFAACQKRNIPVIVANARLSEKSARSYQQIKPIVQDIFSATTCLLAQGDADAERFIALGMPKERVHVTGSLKFDLELPADLAEKGVTLRQTLGENRPIWIAASTHPGEDEIILAAHQKIRAAIPRALLILVPRHPERFDSVEALVVEKNFTRVRRSAKLPCDEKIAVYLGDTMGEMLLMFSASDVAFVAGSFVPVGGHNVIEPAALHKPVITGPYLFNFAEITDLLLRAEGLLKVLDADALARAVIKLFENENDRNTMGENAFQIVLKNRGALSRQLDWIESVIQ